MAWPDSHTPFSPAAMDAGPYPRIHILHTYSLGSAIPPLPHTTCRCCMPSSLYCLPLPSCLHSTPWRVLSRGWGVCLCVILWGGVESLDFTKEDMGLPLQTGMHTLPLVCLCLSLALERGYPRVNIAPFWCLSLWRIQLYPR